MDVLSRVFLLDNSVIFFREIALFFWENELKNWGAVLGKRKCSYGLEVFFFEGMCKAHNLHSFPAAKPVCMLRTRSVLVVLAQSYLYYCWLVLMACVFLIRIKNYLRKTHLPVLTNVNLLYKGTYFVHNRTENRLPVRTWSVWNSSWYLVALTCWEDNGGGRITTSLGWLWQPAVLQ